MFCKFVEILSTLGPHSQFVGTCSPVNGVEVVSTLVFAVIVIATLAMVMFYQTQEN